MLLYYYVIAMLFPIVQEFLNNLIDTFGMVSSFSSSFSLIIYMHVHVYICNMCTASVGTGLYMYM